MVVQQLAQWCNGQGCGVMVKAVVYEAHGGVDRLPAGPRALFSWFQSGRNRLGSCNRFEELNK